MSEKECGGKHGEERRNRRGKNVRSGNRRREK